MSKLILEVDPKTNTPVKKTMPDEENLRKGPYISIPAENNREDLQKEDKKEKGR